MKINKNKNKDKGLNLNLNDLINFHLNKRNAGEIGEDEGIYREFENFLRFQEYSIENLNFILWYRVYKEEFNKLPSKQSQLSPSPKVLRKKQKSNNDIDVGNQPFRQEIDNVINIYFNSSSSFELNLPFDIKFRSIEMLKFSTHPDCFHLSYTHIYDLIQHSSIPQFLSQSQYQSQYHSSNNINRNSSSSHFNNNPRSSKLKFWRYFL